MMNAKEIDKAYAILKTYNGENNQILYLKYRYDNGGILLSEFDCTYVLNNYDYVPKQYNKTVKITRELGVKLQEKYDIDFLPEKIRISKVIGEMGNSLHCYVQYRKSVEPRLMYINQRSILNELEVVDYNKINLDFTELDKKRPLKEHQKIGAKFLIGNKKCIMADDMGVGKTSTAVSASLLGGYKKILVVCPASLKTNWKREFGIYTNKDDIQIIKGSDWESGKKITIVNYDILKNFYEVAEEVVTEDKEVYDANGDTVIISVPVMVKSPTTGKMVYKMRKSRKKENIKNALRNSPLFLEEFDCLIIDEAHKLSNQKSIRYKVIDDFIKKSGIENIWLLTGTPITKSTKNFYSLLKLIDANVAKDYPYYMSRYCGAKKKTFNGKEVLVPEGSFHMEELMEKTKHLYIRRELKDLTDVVKKDILTRYYELTDEQTKEYNRLWDEYVEAQTDRDAEDTEQYKQLVEGMLVRKFLAMEMVSNTITMADEHIEDDEKVVIMCNFDDEIDEFKKYYGKKCVVYKGGMTTKAKDAAVEKFMNDPKIKIFIGNIVAAGVGITLTESHILIFNSFSWASHDNLQAMDRVHRLTQTNDVQIYYQLFDDPISEHMFETVMNKEKVLKTIIVNEKDK